MKWNRILLSSACAFVMAVPAAFAAEACKCVPGQPTAESYTWNFHQEANQLIQQIQDESIAAASHATELQSFTDSPGLTWQAHDVQLSYLKSEIDHMGQQLCRLETIRSAVAPWQQRTINRIARDVVLMANNADDAIHYVNSHQGLLWNPTYENNLKNLANVSYNLRSTTSNAVEFAHVRAKDRELRRAMEMRSSS
jgi:hypothetical protein